jgi:hypothetical protein
MQPWIATAATDNGPAMNVGQTRAPRIPAGVPAGTLATITMDLAMVAAARFGGALSVRTASAPT